MRSTWKTFKSNLPDSITWKNPMRFDILNQMRMLLLQAIGLVYSYPTIPSFIVSIGNWISTRICQQDTEYRIQTTNQNKCLDKYRQTSISIQLQQKKSYWLWFYYAIWKNCAFRGPLWSHSLWWIDSRIIWNVSNWKYMWYCMYNIIVFSLPRQPHQL